MGEKEKGEDRRGRRVAPRRVLRGLVALTGYGVLVLVYCYFMVVHWLVRTILTAGQWLRSPVDHLRGTQEPN